MKQPGSVSETGGLRVTGGQGRSSGWEGRTNACDGQRLEGHQMAWAVSPGKHKSQGLATEGRVGCSQGDELLARLSIRELTSDPSLCPLEGWLPGLVPGPGLF